MKKKSIFISKLFLSILLIFIGRFSYAQTKGDTVKTGKTNDAMVIGPGKVSDDGTVVKPGKTNDNMAVMTDTGFISKNISDNIMEIQLSKLGLRKGTSPLVKKAATVMIADHTAILNDLKKLAAKKHVSSAENSMQNMTAMPPVNIPKGADFDAKWASAMLAMHEAKIAELQNFISATQDYEIKAAVAKALPKIKMHRQMLAKIPGVKAMSGSNTVTQ